MSRRWFLAGFLVVALLVAGVASYYASSRPDGLNFVAQQQGFSNHQKESPTAHGPLAGYTTKGVENPRLSRGVAGVAGCVLVLAIGSGLFWVLRRRGDEDAAAGSGDSTTSGA